MPPEKLDANPYIPDQGVIGDVSAEAVSAGLADSITSIRQGAWQAWMWPTAGLLFWLAVDNFYERLEFWLFEVPDIQPPSRESIMGGVVTISSLMWLMGCRQQIVLLARIRQLPGVRKHLVAGVVASGVCLLVAINSWYSVKSRIIEYGGDRGPVPQPIPDAMGID